MRGHDERWKDLCRQASVEQDPVRLSELVHEINEILSPSEEPGDTSTRKPTENGD
jgi:hypothetical protein